MWGEEGELGVGLLLVANAVFENGTISRNITSSLFDDGTNVSGRKNNTFGSLGGRLWQVWDCTVLGHG